VAEALILVCDECGVPATETVTIRVGRKSLQKDLCEQHLLSLLEHARPTRRGRPRKTASGHAASANRPSSRVGRRGTPGPSQAA